MRALPGPKHLPQGQDCPRSLALLDYLRAERQNLTPKARIDDGRYGDDSDPQQGRR
jgi:hypothetical protein